VYLNMLMRDGQPTSLSRRAADGSEKAHQVARVGSLCCRPELPRSVHLSVGRWPSVVHTEAVAVLR